MEEKKYYVEMDGTTLAENMDIYTALILVEIAIQKYPGDMNLGSLVSIGEMNKNKDKSMLY